MDLCGRYVIGKASETKTFCVNSEEAEIRHVRDGELVSSVHTTPEHATAEYRFFRKAGWR